MMIIFEFREELRIGPDYLKGNVFEVRLLFGSWAFPDRESGRCCRQ